MKNIADLKESKVRITCPKIKPAICRKFLDWTLVTEGEKNGHKMAPVILLRDPVMRAASHFHFWETLRNESLTEYLAHREPMLHTRQFWFDGSVSTVIPAVFKWWLWTIALIKSRPITQ